MSKQAILIIGHGSRDPVSTKEFMDFTQEYRNYAVDLRFGTQTECAFLELSEPSIPDTLHRMASEGVDRIIVYPYLLFSAGHVKTEIPGIIGEFSKTRPEIKIQYGDCLWPHDNLIKLAKKRIQDTLEAFPESVKDQVDILVVGRGATDPQAIGQFEEVIERIREEVSCRQLKHCYIALAEPRYADALPQMLKEGFRALLIFPFYLFTGILVKRIESQAAELCRQYPDSIIKIAPYFGSHPLMFEMLREKVEMLNQN